MANVRAVDFFGQSGFDLSALLTNAETYYYYNNKPFKYWGTKYPDAFESVFEEDGNFLNLQFTGQNIVAKKNVEESASNEMTGGTVQGMFLDTWDGENWQNGWSIKGISVKAAAITAAIKTKSTKDDVKIFSEAFSGDDVFKLHNSDDTAFAYDGDDEMYGRKGRDQLEGGRGDDKIFGGTEADALFGNRGNDEIGGGNGFDLIVGGAGNDLMTGGRGQDTFRFYDTKGRDVITDFQDDLDTLALSAELWSGNLNRRQVVETYAEIEGGRVVFDFGDQEIVLRGFDDLNALVDDISII